MHIIIDADPIVYRAGFAAETHNYHVVYETPDGELVDKYFDKDEEHNAGDKKKLYHQDHPDYVVLSDDRIVETEPLAFALRGVKITIEAAIKDALREAGHNGEAYTTTVLLSGPDNFRESLATIKPYKGNRDAAYKPVHYQAIRDYLCNRWDARVIEGHEADDEASILAWMEVQNGGECVVCTIDKDLDQIPVPHYDYAKKVYYEISDFAGKEVFYKQALCGDATDNIQGLFRVGEAAAVKMLDAWAKDYDDLQHMQDTVGEDRVKVPEWEEYWWGRTVTEYEKNMEKYPDKYPEGMTAEEAALENARLVFMQTYRGQLWTPPGTPDEETT